jgi:UPF0755 protein
MLRWLLLGLTLLGMCGGVAGVAIIANWWQAAGPAGAAQTLVIAKGGTQSIAAQLSRAGIIDHPLWFSLAAKATGEGSSFKAGEYAFAARLSPAAVADMLDRGDVVVHRLIIPEGLTTSEALAIVATAPALSGGVVKAPGEGGLLPSTYFYVYGDQRQVLVDRMTRELTKTLSGLWARRAPGLPLKSPHEAIVLASIVEKETALPSERRLIASVFYNRLRRGMRLQSDPTVIYALTAGRGPLGRSLTHDDMASPSPYNTYVVAGLPPGPIANPGRAAIEAVLHPEPTDALYFVASGDGGHRFAATLREQDQNIARWRARQRASAP